MPLLVFTINISGFDDLNLSSHVISKSRAPKARYILEDEIFSISLGAGS